MRGGELRCLLEWGHLVGLIPILTGITGTGDLLLMACLGSPLTGHPEGNAQGARGSYAQRPSEDAGGRAEPS